MDAYPVLPLRWPLVDSGSALSAVVNDREWLSAA
jgi:hypothetical protein